jgi:hypothetical protein
MERRLFSKIALVALLIGCGIGVLAGAVGGAALASQRDRDGCVARAEYSRVCDEAESMAMLYYAERKLNVQLTKSHRSAHVPLAGQVVEVPLLVFH